MFLRTLIKCVYVCSLANFFSLPVFLFSEHIHEFYLQNTEIYPIKRINYLHSYIDRYGRKDKHPKHVIAVV